MVNFSRYLLRHEENLRFGGPSLSRFRSITLGYRPLKRSFSKKDLAIRLFSFCTVFMGQDVTKFSSHPQSGL